MLFKKLKKYFNLYIYFIFLVIFFLEFSTAKVFSNTYKIENLKVSETYDLEFNKINIIDKAFKNAFDELIAKITISIDKKKIKDTKLDTIKGLVDSFTIVNEKFIDSKYYASFDVNFDKKGILNFLERKNIFPSVPKEKKIVLMPILINTNSKQISLFSENLFFTNWNEQKENYHLLKYLLPNEDLDDINIIKNNLENIEEYDFIEIVSKYNLKDNIIIIFFKDNENLRILSKMNFDNDSIILNRKFENVNFSDKQKLLNIIFNLKTDYENHWKKINQINTSIKLPLTILLESKKNFLIESFENTLQELDYVSHFYTDSFNNNNIIYKISYNNTPDKFISEIKDKGFDIDISKGVWEIK